MIDRGFSRSGFARVDSLGDAIDNLLGVEPAGLDSADNPVPGTSDEFNHTVVDSDQVLGSTSIMADLGDVLAIHLPEIWVNESSSQHN